MSVGHVAWMLIVFFGRFAVVVLLRSTYVRKYAYMILLFPTLSFFLIVLLKLPYTEIPNRFVRRGFIYAAKTTKATASASAVAAASATAAAAAAIAAAAAVCRSNPP